MKNCKCCGSELNIIEIPTEKDSDGKRFITTEAYGKVYVHELPSYDEYLCCLYNEDEEQLRPGPTETFPEISGKNGQRAIPILNHIDTHYRQIAKAVHWNTTRGETK